MKIALIGASGFIGSALREEALDRGHQVTALVSHPKKLNATATNLSVKQVDVQDTAQLTQTLSGADVVISAFSGHAQDDIRGYYVQGVKSIIAAVKAADVPRLVIVGGAGSLRVAADTRLIDTPAFPDFDRHRPADNVAGRKVLGVGCVTLHKAFVVRIRQIAAFAA